MAGLTTNGVPVVAPGAAYSAVTGYEVDTMDTQLSGGRYPETVAASVFLQCALSAALAANTASATAGAATLSTLSGHVVSEALTTAAGASYTLTLTNTTVTAASNVQAAAYSGTNTTPGLVVTSVTPASGDVVIVVKNTGSVALNGTLVIPFLVAPN